MILEYFTNVPSEPTLAILPILLIALGALAVGGTIIAIANSDGTSTTKITGKSIAILGMQEAGKTQLLRTLQNKSYSTYEATSIDDYSLFKVIINGEEFTFTGGRDIGGDEKYIPTYYEKYIKEKDAIFFIFDVRKYLNNSIYATDVRNRLSFVYRKLKDRYPSANQIDNKYLTIGSHMDKLPQSQQKTAIKQLQDSVYGKDYADLFHNNLLLCDLTNRENLFKNLVDRKII